MRDYGKVHTSFWSSSNIRELSDDGRTLALYILTCPHGTIAGAFRIPNGYAAEDLQWSFERVSKGFAELFQKGFATRCEGTSWVWVTKHFDWNPPENPNQRKSVQKIVDQIPDECTWKRDFMRVCWSFYADSAPCELNPSETLSKPFLNQEQEQEQEQEKEEKNKYKKKIERESPLKFKAEHMPEIPSELATEFIQHRKAMKAPLTKIAWQGICRESEIAGWTVKQAVEETMTRGWRSFKAEWVLTGNRNGNNRQIDYSAPAKVERGIAERNARRQAESFGATGNADLEGEFERVPL